MQIQSLGLATEVALARLRGEVIDRGDYLVVRTPDDPTYFYGNLLALPRAPQAGEIARWTEVFAQELGRDPLIRHATLSWDGIAGELGAADELRDAGFAIETAQVMTSRGVSASPIAGDPIAIRALAADDFTRVTQLAFATADHHDDAHRNFTRRRCAWQRTLVERNLARFWGAFDGDLLVGSLGLVPLAVGHRRVARYQDVQVADSYRRRGIASALLAASANELLAHGIREVAIIALPDAPAAQIYARAGLAKIEQIASACRYPSAI